MREVSGGGEEGFYEEFTKAPHQGKGNFKFLPEPGNVKPPPKFINEVRILSVVFPPFPFPLLPQHPLLKAISSCKRLNLEERRFNFNQM